MSSTVSGHLVLDDERRVGSIVRRAVVFPPIIDFRSPSVHRLGTSKVSTRPPLFANHGAAALKMVPFVLDRSRYTVLIEEFTPTGISLFYRNTATAAMS